jgi:hypothetical protein
MYVCVLLNLRANVLSCRDSNTGVGKSWFFFFETVCAALGILICSKIFSHIPYYEKGIEGIFLYEKKSICCNLKLGHR